MAGTGLGGTGASWTTAGAPAKTSSKARYTKAAQRYIFTSMAPLEGLSKGTERCRSMGPPQNISCLARLPLWHTEKTTHNSGLGSGYLYVWTSPCDRHLPRLYWDSAAAEMVRGAAVFSRRRCGNVLFPCSHNTMAYHPTPARLPDPGRCAEAM